MYLQALQGRHATDDTSRQATRTDKDRRLNGVTMARVNLSIEISTIAAALAPLNYREQLKRTPRLRYKFLFQKVPEKNPSKSIALLILKLSRSSAEVTAFVSALASGEKIF